MQSIRYDFPRLRLRPQRFWLVIGLVVLPVLIAGCGTKTPDGSIRETNGIPAVRSGQPTPGEIVATRSGRTIREDNLYDTLSEADVIFVGERHGHPGSHRVQRQIIEELHNRDSSLAIGFELLRENHQTLLDQWSQGQLSLDDVRSQPHETSNRARIVNYYRNILAFARTNDLPLVALKPTKEAVNRFRGKTGKSHSGDPERRNRPLMPQEKFLKKTFEQHVPTGRGLYSYMSVQRYWERTMAKNIHGYLSQDDSASRMVVLTGNLHVFYDFGIPEKLDRRASYHQQSVLTLPANHTLEEALKLPESIKPAHVTPADYVWWINPRSKDS